MTALLLLAPQLPLLFMGEEWGARTPFLFFCDFHGALADAVREGRRREFARFREFADPGAARAHPRPQRRGDLRGAAASTGRRSAQTGHAALARLLHDACCASASERRAAAGRRAAPSVREAAHGADRDVLRVALDARRRQSRLRAARRISGPDAPAAPRGRPATLLFASHPDAEAALDAGPAARLDDAVVPRGPRDMTAGALDRLADLRRHRRRCYHDIVRQAPGNRADDDQARAAGGDGPAPSTTDGADRARACARLERAPCARVAAARGRARPSAQRRDARAAPAGGATAGACAGRPDAEAGAHAIGASVPVEAARRPASRRRRRTACSVGAARARPPACRSATTAWRRRVARARRRWRAAARRRDAHRRAAALLRRRRPRLRGRRGAALRAALRAQLGHRRLHRPARLAGGAAGSAPHRRRQSAARPVPADPAHCSPYAPRAALFLNVLYIDVEAVAGAGGLRRARTRWSRRRRSRRSLPPRATPTSSTTPAWPRSSCRS